MLGGLHLELYLATRVRRREAPERWAAHGYEVPVVNQFGLFGTPFKIKGISYYITSACATRHASKCRREHIRNSGHRVLPRSGLGGRLDLSAVLIR